MTVDPGRADLERLAAEDEGGPVVMLNLLRYADGGAGSYREYAEKVGTHLERVGASVLYAGTCSTPLVAPDGWEWDGVLVVRYPSRRAFLDMVADPAYQGITGLRTRALDAAVLQATIPWG